jgi:hypothetical protein
MTPIHRRDYCEAWATAFSGPEASNTRPRAEWQEMGRLKYNFSDAATASAPATDDKRKIV